LKAASSLAEWLISFCPFHDYFLLFVFLQSIAFKAVELFFLFALHLAKQKIISFLVHNTYSDMYAGIIEASKHTKIHSAKYISTPIIQDLMKESKNFIALFYPALSSFTPCLHSLLPQRHQL